MVNHDVPPGPLNHCQVCGNEKLALIIDLGHQPLCDSLLSREQLDQPEVTYPLRLFRCPDCTLTQLDYVVSGSEVYHQAYPYKSGVTRELVEYMNALSGELAVRYELTSDDLVVDIGSNDGTLLAGFKVRDIRVLGVEPTDIARLANESGIKTVQGFFTEEIAGQIRDSHGPASLVTATNVFAHMAELGETIRSMLRLLADDGVIVIEIHYLLAILQRNQFDSIYHEHIRSYSLKSLVTLFEQYDMQVFHAETANRYGGNLRIHVSHRGVRDVTPDVQKLLDAEGAAGLDQPGIYREFAENALRQKQKMMEFIHETLAQGKSIVGNSCPGRCSTLINFYGIDKTHIPYIAEQPASLKKGLFLPGKHIPVVDNSILADEQPDFIILLAWHYQDAIVAYLRERGVKSKLVAPLPEFAIVDG